MKKKQKQTDRNGYPLSPVNVSRWLWYYEERKGLCIVIQHRTSTGKFIGHIPAFYLPWGKVCRSVDRHRKLKRKRT